MSLQSITSRPSRMLQTCLVALTTVVSLSSCGKKDAADGSDTALEDWRQMCRAECECEQESEQNACKDECKSDALEKEFQEFPDECKEAISDLADACPSEESCQDLTEIENAGKECQDAFMAAIEKCPIFGDIDDTGTDATSSDDTTSDDTESTDGTDSTDDTDGEVSPEVEKLREACVAECQCASKSEGASDADCEPACAEIFVQATVDMLSDSCIDALISASETCAAEGLCQETPDMDADEACEEASMKAEDECS